MHPTKTVPKYLTRGHFFFDPTNPHQTIGPQVPQLIDSPSPYLPVYSCNYCIKSWRGSYNLFCLVELSYAIIIVFLWVLEMAVLLLLLPWRKRGGRGQVGTAMFGLFPQRFYLRGFGAGIGNGRILPIRQSDSFCWVQGTVEQQKPEKTRKWLPLENYINTRGNEGL